MRPMKTFTLLLGLFLLAVTPCQAVPEPVARPLEKVRLQLKWLHQFQFAGFYAALHQGYYREAGLDVEIMEIHPHESAVDVVMRGDAEFGVHGSDLIHSHYSQRHSLEHLLFEAEQTRRLVSPDYVEIGHMNPGRWRHIADTYATLGMMPAEFALDEFLVELRPKPQDYTRYYLLVGASLTILALAVWMSLYFSRLNRALRREVQERQRLQEDLERLANTDVLTGLPNRRFFMQQLDRRDPGGGQR